MARRTVGRAVVRSMKRPTFWEGDVDTRSLVSGAEAMVVVVPEATLENVPSPTLIRIHGEVFTHVTARGAAGDACILGMGMIPQSAAAISVGVTSMPHPVTDVGSPWIWHRQVAFDSNIAPPNGTDIGGNVRTLVDNKSMRKFELNQGLVIVLQNFVITGTLTLSIVFSFRFLFKR